jgi:hypothetical protein
MDDIRLEQCRNQNTKDHLTPLILGEEVLVDDGGRSSGSIAWIRNRLGRR